VLIGVGLFAIVSGWRFGVWEGSEPGPGLLPSLAGASLSLFAGWSLFVAPPAASEGQVFLPRLAGYVVGLLGFGLLMKPLGAIVVIVLLFLWILGIVERLAWQRVLVITVCASAGAWLLFDRLLGVPLPRFAA
jgi:putative tricarboxylic transport membrane protein